MQENLRIHFVPPVPKREKRVGIYCRVSTNSAEQLHSLISFDKINVCHATMGDCRRLYGYCHLQDGFIKESTQSFAGRL